MALSLFFSNIPREERIRIDLMNMSPYGSNAYYLLKKWHLPIRNWAKVYGEFCIMYPGRMPETN
jgi:hypothetical protein